MIPTVLTRCQFDISDRENWERDPTYTKLRLKATVMNNLWRKRMFKLHRKGIGNAMIMRSMPRFVLTEPSWPMLRSRQCPSGLGFHNCEMSGLQVVRKTTKKLM